MALVYNSHYREILFARFKAEDLRARLCRRKFSCTHKFSVISFSLLEDETDLLLTFLVKVFVHSSQGYGRDESGIRLSSGGFAGSAAIGTDSNIQLPKNEFLR